MIDTAAGTSERLVDEIREFDRVTEAHVAGEFDIVVELEGERTYDLQRVLSSQVAALDGVGTMRTYVVLA